MNAKELIDEVAGTILVPSYSRTDILKVLNVAQGVIAGRILLPGLADGHNTVQTVVDDYSVAVPEDFHRELFAAKVNGLGVKLLKTHADIVAHFGSLVVTPHGEVIVVAVHAGKVQYQYAPSVATDIELFYHRKPVAMSDAADSYPDGAGTGSVPADGLDMALIFYTNWRFFHKIEHGIENPKVDSRENLDLFEKEISNLDLLCAREGKSYAAVAPNKVW